MEKLRQLWYWLLDPVIKALSLLALIFQKKTLKSGYLEAEDIPNHEASHPLANTRYKEWYYFDFHSDCGQVISCSIVFSLVQPHYFVWIFKPQSNQVFIEVQQDGQVITNTWKNPGVSLEAESLKITGNFEEGYQISFQGERFSGELKFFEPIVGRGELHVGQEQTYYALYQIPQLQVKGNLWNRTTQEQTQLSGVGYHDHWWGIENRVTRWNWVQIKFNNGWVVGVYEGRYGRKQTDIHQYSWLYRPDLGYDYFDENTIKLEVIEPNTRWSIILSGKSGKLTLVASRRFQIFQYKRVQLVGIPLGEVDYYQYPITTEGEFVSNNQEKTLLSSTSGMLEWDWLAIW